METPWTVDLTLGNKTEVKAKVHMAEIEIEERKGPMRIATFDDAVPLIGIDTLETLGSKVNPATAKSERSEENSPLHPRQGLKAKRHQRNGIPQGSKP